MRVQSYGQLVKRKPAGRESWQENRNLAGKAVFVMKKIPVRALVALLWLSLVMAAGSRAAYADGLVLEGLVRGPGEAPMADVQIALSPLSSNHQWSLGVLTGQTPAPRIVEARSDASGRFVLMVPGPGLWKLRAAAPGYVPMRRQPLLVVESTILPPVDLTADVGSRIQILSAAGEPMAGVWNSTATGVTS